MVGVETARGRLGLSILSIAVVSLAHGGGSVSAEPPAYDPCLEDSPSANGSTHRNDRADGARGPQSEPCDPGWPALEDALIRPGATHNIAGDFGEFSDRDCAANFIFSSLDNRTLYIGGVSHCVQGMSVGDQVRINGIPEAGTLVYCSIQHVFELPDCGPALGPDLPMYQDTDFALIEINGAYRNVVHPAVQHWGGPTGMAEPPPVGTRLIAYFNDQYWRDQPELSAAEGIVYHSTDPETTSVWAHTYLIGDSGSPVMLQDGQAVGAICREIVDEVPPKLTSANLRHNLDYMKAKIGLEVELKTWHLFENALLP